MMTASKNNILYVHIVLLIEIIVLKLKQLEFLNQVDPTEGPGHEFCPSQS
jgi:hypothetical protein